MRRIIIFIFQCGVLAYAAAAEAQQQSSIATTAEITQGAVSVPVGEDVYTFLRSLSVKGLINGYSESALPLMESQITAFLLQAQDERMTSVQRALRQKYLRTYLRRGHKDITLFPAKNADPLLWEGIISPDQDKYLYQWYDEHSHSVLQVNALGSIETRIRTRPEKGHTVLGVIGGRIKGTLSGSVGYYLQATNGQNFGDSSLALEDPVIGKNKNFAVFSNHTFYDATTAEIRYRSDWFQGALSRIPMAVGGSYSGDNITLNANVQPYDALTIRGDVGAVTYQAMVASLLGESRFSEHRDSQYYEFGSAAYIDPKYLAVHHLNIRIGSSVDFGFTDMTVFSRRFDLAYVNPFSFMKSVEHSLNDRDNGLIGTHLRWRITDGLEFRGQGILDDIVAGKIGTGYWSNKLAWQTGLMWTEPFGIENIDWMIEYTHIEPYTFSHFNPQNAFTTSGALLSSEIGPNSIRIWSGIRWQPSERINLYLQGSMTAHGENIYDSTGALIDNYGGDYILTPGNQIEGERAYHILGGKRVNIFLIDGTVRYEPIRGIEMFARAMVKNAVYVHGTPVNPLQRDYGLVSVGIKAVL